MYINKMLNVLPFHGDFAHCLDECMISVANYFGLDFILMYSQAWGFSFVEKFYQGKSIGYSLDADRGAIYELLNLYHGTQVTFFNKTESDQVINIIINELNKNKPVGVSMDTYFYSWDPNKNQHGRHWFLITGVDTEKELFYCTDPFFQKKDTLLEFRNFLDGYLGVYFTFNRNKVKIKEFNLKEIISKTIDKISGKNEHHKSIFENMLMCADYIENNISLENEKKENARIMDMPFYVSLQAISRGRKQYALFIEDIASKYNIQEFYEVAEKLKSASNKWDVIRGIMVKGIVLSNERIIKEKLPPKIRNIAKYEHDILDLMLRIVNEAASSKNHSITNTVKRSQLNKNDNSLNKYTYINLEKYFNNIGFGSMHKKETTANLNGTGLFFVAEDIPAEEIWCIEDMSFKFPKYVDEKKDNIACCEQIIEVPNIEGSNLMILATADFGSFNDIITVRYKDGSHENIPISCTEYLFEPMYEECVAWKGRACERDNHSINIYNSKVRIFAKNYKLIKPGIITSIKLPFLPNIHIFSITIK